MLNKQHFSSLLKATSSVFASLKENEGQMRLRDATSFEGDESHHEGSSGWETTLLPLWRTRHKHVSVFCLKHSDCCDRKVVTIKEGPLEVGLCCTETTSFSDLRLMLSVPASRWGLSLSLQGTSLQGAPGSPQTSFPGGL